MTLALFAMLGLPALLVLLAWKLTRSDRPSEADDMNARRRAEQLGRISEMSGIVVQLTHYAACAGVLAGKQSNDEALAEINAARAAWRADMVAFVDAVLVIPTLPDDKRADAVLLLRQLQRDDVKPSDVHVSLGGYR